ncbi:FadR/GntR family transcriptional regulator [Stigmatella aurantiaca]|nr:GntR family transcriptional regulator [Stigmatella aurantiaca]EAU68352.1 minus agglutinin [Stigmatella aurantiaca DW4/3-1]
MEWVGLVGRVEQDLERVISQGLLPQDGFLPSENSLAKHYGLSRSTVREALKRLAARELIEQHPGRRSRALPLEGAVTLENLGVVLEGPGAAQPERRKLLEGFLALKRETAVELLAACCQQASARDLDTLAGLCFELAEEARWGENPGRWAELEFALLRQAARAVERPGQALLLQSLERSYRGMARRLVPHLNAQATRQWALCALHALAAKDAQPLRQELPALLQASDGHLLAGLPPPQEPRGSLLPPLSADTVPHSPSPQEPKGSSQPPLCADTAPSHPTSEPEDATERLSEANRPILSACPTGLSQRPPTGGSPPEAPSSDSCTPLVEGAPGSDVPQGQEASRRVPPGLQERPFLAPVGGDSGVGRLGRGGHLLDGTAEGEPGGACTAEEAGPVTGHRVPEEGQGGTGAAGVWGGSSPC